MVRRAMITTIMIGSVVLCGCSQPAQRQASTNGEKPSSLTIGGWVINTDPIDNPIETKTASNELPTIRFTSNRYPNARVVMTPLLEKGAQDVSAARRMIDAYYRKAAETANDSKSSIADKKIFQCGNTLKVSFTVVRNSDNKTIVTELYVGTTILEVLYIGDLEVSVLLASELSIKPANFLDKEWIKAN